MLTHLKGTNVFLKESYDGMKSHNGKYMLQKRVRQSIVVFCSS